MRVHQFREFCKDFHYLVGTFTTSRDNYDIRFRLFGDSVLKHRLTCTEGAGDKSCTTFHNRVQRIDYTYTGFQQFERTRLFFVIRHSPFHRPFLNHRYRDVISFFICQDSNGIFYLIISFRHNGLYGSRSVHSKRSHNFQRLEVFVHLSQPCGSYDFITGFHHRNKMPYTFFIQRICILSSFQENTVHLVKVVLQTIVVLR